MIILPFKLLWIFQASLQRPVFLSLFVAGYRMEIKKKNINKKPIFFIYKKTDLCMIEFPCT